MDLTLLFSNLKGITNSYHRDVAIKQRQVEQLETLCQLGRELSPLHDEAAIIKLVLETAAAMFQSDRVVCHLVEEQTGKPTRGYRLEMGQTEITFKVSELHPTSSPKPTTNGILTGRGRPKKDLAFEELNDETSHSDCSDVQVLRALLKDGEQLIGVLMIDIAKLSRFTLTDPQMLQKIADQAAIALTNARLRARMKSRIEQLTMLQELDRALSANLHLDGVYNTLVGHTERLLSYDRMGIALVDGTEIKAAFLAPNDDKTPPVGTSWPLDGSAFGWVVTRNQSLLRHNITPDGSFAGDELMLAAGIRAMMMIPLRFKRRLIGVWNIGSQQIGAYRPDDLVIAQAIANQLAVALENAHLHEELQAQFEALQQARARLVQNEKLVAIGQFVAGVVHELNNPLTSILGLADLLQHNGSGSEISRDLEKMAAQARRARRIVRGLMDFAHQSPLARRPVQVNEILSAILDLLAQDLHAYHVRWSIDLASDLPLTMADPHQLQQVFINLISNAGQAMKNAHDGGHLKISSELASPTYYPHSTQAEPVIRIIIVDDGPGISPEVLLHIFDPFFTTKPAGEGTGLGLAICHRIMSAHRGHIWAESEQGQGTAFFIELPVAGIEETYPRINEKWA